jgi:hypothetical protein
MARSAGHRRVQKAATEPSGDARISFDQHDAAMQRTGSIRDMTART